MEEAKEEQKREEEEEEKEAAGFLHRWTSTNILFSLILALLDLLVRSPLDPLVQYETLFALAMSFSSVLYHDLRALI